MQINPSGALLHAISRAAAPTKTGAPDAASFQVQARSATAPTPPVGAESPGAVEKPASVEAPSKTDAGGRPTPLGSVLDIVV